MPTKRSNPQKRSPDKKQASARQNATGRIAERRNNKADPGVPVSEKRRSQGRFPGETPLTGEDRPADRAGGKKQGKTANRAPATSTGRRTPGGLGK